MPNEPPSLEDELGTDPDLGERSGQIEPRTRAKCPEPVCEQAPYPRYGPGEYEAECVGTEIFYDRQFHSWKCSLRFSLLGDGGPVFCFLHLGSKQRPVVGARSEYRRAWIIANGEQPRRRQVMSPRVFVGKIFGIRIADVQRRFDGREHPTSAIYSVVREVVKRTYP
jgi:hypothetical protein